MQRPNMYEQLLENARLERIRRHERRKLEQAKYLHLTAMPKFTPQDDIKPPMEARDYIYRKVKSLLND